MNLPASDNPACAAVGDDAVLFALRRLGRSNRWAVVGKEPDTHADCIEVVRHEDKKVTGCDGRIVSEVWRHLLACGLVVPDGDVSGSLSSAWRLSNAGRIHLRRLMSRAGAPGTDTQVAKTAAASRESEPELRSKSQVQSRDESPLTWLRRRRDKVGRPLISAAEFDAGERLRADFTLGRMEAQVTSNWSPMAGHGGRKVMRDGELTISEAAVAARDRVRGALASVGPEMANVLLDVCCYLKGLESIERDAGWPQRSGKVVLGMALRMLARHYAGERDVHGRAGAA